MTNLDYVVLIAYIAGVFAIGGLFGGRIKSSRDMFAAGGTSPWWVSGLSGFMTMFSAGTFVVWGGIAYRHGLIAISISLCYGISALLVGWFLAGKWRQLGITTAAEFIERRFGKAAVHFYTWTGMVYRLSSVGVAIYSVAVLLSALVPLPDGFPMRDPASGTLALGWSILIFGGIVVIYTTVGGLWAVLMTDVLQFIILSLSVMVAVPLILMHDKIGGIGGFFTAAPDGFFHPTSGEFTWFFLAGWVAIHFFVVGGEWAFVQRFLCVPTPRDAKKSSLLFGVMYLISPVIWMLPPMAYRLINPNANPEEAYILACREVLPAGIVGLLLAAMFSATASMVDSQLNVFSGVLTRDFYRPLFDPKATEQRLVAAGRIITVALGSFMVLFALSVPYLGGAERLVISIASLLVVPLLSPSVWGLLSPRIGVSAVWITTGICFSAGAIAAFGLSANGFLADIPALTGLASWVQAHPKTTEIAVGVVLPVIILTVIERFGKGINPGWERVQAAANDLTEDVPSAPSTLPAKIVVWNTGGLGVLLLGIGVIQADGRGVLFIFAASMLLIAAVITGITKKTVKKSS